MGVSVLAFILMSSISGMKSAQAQYGGSPPPLPTPGGGPTPPGSGSSGHGRWEIFKWEYEGANIVRQFDKPESVTAWIIYGPTVNTPQAEPTGGAGSVSIAGKMRPILRWVRGTKPDPNYSGTGFPPNIPDPNDNPEDKIYLLYSGNGEGWAGADQRAWYSAYANTVRDLSKEHVTLSMLGKTMNGADLTGATNAKLDVRQLTPLATKGKMHSDAQGNELLDGEWLDLNLIASVDGDRYYPDTGSGSSAKVGYVYLRASAGATLDDRRVSISRSTDGDFKREDDPNLNKDRDLWIDADGTKHAHTTYSYNYEPITAPSFKQSYYNSQTFSANTSGWSSSATGIWSPSDTADTKTQHKQDMPLGSPEQVIEDPDNYGTSYIWSGDPTSGAGKASVSYTITDPDGTTDTALYQLTLHDEWERGKTLKAINPFLGDPITLNQGYEPSNTGAGDKVMKFTVDTSQTKTLTNKIQTESSLNLSVGALSKLPALKGAVDLTGKAEAAFSIKDLHEITDETEKSLSLSDSYAITLKPGETAHPVYWVRSNHQEFELLHWLPSGFGGVYTATTDSYNDIQGGQNPVIFGWSDKGQVQDPKPNQP